MPVSNDPTVTDRSELLAILFASIDAMDTATFSSKLSPTAVFRFGAADEVKGREAISAVVAQFFSSIGGVRHELTNVISEGDSLACEGSVSYTRKDATTLTLPFANVFEFDRDLIAGYRIYVDIGPLYG